VSQSHRNCWICCYYYYCY